MYEKIALIVLALFVIASSEEVSLTRTEVKDADFPDSRLSSILLLPSSYNDQPFTKARANRRSVFSLTPLLHTRSKQRQSRNAAQKTKRCSTHRKRFSLSSANKNFAKTKDSNANTYVGTSRDIPYVSAKNTKYSSENPATTRWPELETRDENKMLLRALQDSLQDAQDSVVNMDSQKETNRYKKFVCYCQEENCGQKSSKTDSSRMLGSSRKIKPGRMNNRRPILGASILHPGSSRWYQAHHDPRIFSLIDSVPVRPRQKITQPGLFVPLLHGEPLVPFHIIGKDGKLIKTAFPYTSLDEPDFTVGDIHHQRRPILRQGSQECRYSSQKNQFDVSTESTTSAWGDVGATANLNEESSTTDFSTLRETTANYLGAFISPVTESNVELKNIVETTEISAAETFPRLGATFPTDHVASVTEAGTKDNFESYFSSGTVRASSVDDEFAKFVTTPEISYDRTDTGTRSDLNPYYSETTRMRTTTETSTDLFRETLASWTNGPGLTENRFPDQKMKDVELTSTESYEDTRPTSTEFYDYVETTEPTYRPNEDYDARYSDENKLSSINKYIPMKKLTEQTTDEVAKSELLGKSKSHTTKMLLNPSYDGGSTTENSQEGEKLLYSTISYQSNEDESDLAMTNAIRENSWTSDLPFGRKIYGGETTTPYYESTTDRNFKEATANILMKSITETYPWRTTLQDQLLTTAQYSNREKTNDVDKGDLEYTTTESLLGITKSLVKELCGDSLLLGSIRRVINNFASSGDLTKVQDEDALQAQQDESLLPEILQIPNLKDILLTPQIEDTIVAKVKGILSNVKNKSNLVNASLQGKIKNALRKLLGSFHNLHHEKKLPLITVKEHQFNNGQWQTKLVTLSPVYEENSDKLSMQAPGRLHESIKDLLGNPAVASQANRQVVRNMIVESLKNNLASKGESKDNGLEIKDSVILDALNNALQMLRESKDMSVKDALKGDDIDPKVESVNEENASTPRETTMRNESEDDYKTEGNVEQMESSGMKQFQKDTLVDGTETQRTSYQKVEKLDSNLQVLTACDPANLMKPENLYEGEAVGLTASLLPETTTMISSTDAKAFYEGQTTENVLNMASTTEDVEINQQHSKIYIPQEAMEYTTKNVYTTEGTVEDNILNEREHVDKQYTKTENPWKTTVSINNMQETIVGSPNEENIAGIEAITVQNQGTPSISRSETNTQQSESSNCASWIEPEVSSSKPEITKWYGQMSTDFDEITSEIAKQNSFTSKPFTADEASDKTLAAAVPVQRIISMSSTDGEPQISTTDFYGESLMIEKSDDEMTQKNTINTTEILPKYDEMDPTMLRATNDVDALPINYYSPNDRILNYVKSHRVDNEDETTATVSSMQKSSSHYGQLSDEANLNKDTAAATKMRHEMKYTDPLLSQQEFQTGDVIKIHEVTTEVQKTHAKTVYFQPRQFGPEDNSRTNSLAIAYESPSVGNSNDNFNKNGNSNDCSDNPSDKKIDNDNDGDVGSEANKNIVSATQLPLEDISDTLQVFRSSAASEESIEQLRKSQLYYISDSVKLPLEIRKLKDGTYTLSISKNICEQILKRRCSVPLQGHVIQSPRSNTRANNAEEDYQSTVQPLSSMTNPLRNTLQKLEKETEEELNVYRLGNYRRKRDLIEKDSIAIVSMPVIDFARKYNLSLDFDEKKMTLNELRSSGKVWNFGETVDSLKQLTKESEHNQLNDKNPNGNSEVEESGLKDKKNGKVGLQDSINTQNKNILEENGKRLRKAGLRKSHASRSTNVETIKLCKLEDEDDNQSENLKRIMDSSKQASNSISNGTDIFEREAKFTTNEMKWGDFEILVKKKGEIPEEIKLIKLKNEKKNEQHTDNTEQNKLNVSENKVLKNMRVRPYRYQRNTNSSTNKGTEVVKNFLYWLKDLLLDTKKIIYND